MNGSRTCECGRVKVWRVVNVMLVGVEEFEPELGEDLGLVRGWGNLIWNSESDIGPLRNIVIQRCRNVIKMDAL